MFIGERVNGRKETREQPSTSASQRSKSRSRSAGRNANTETALEYTKEDYEMVQR